MIESIEHSFLETAEHYDTLGEYGRRYASFLTFTALNRGDAFTETQLKEATGRLPEEGLAYVTNLLLDTLTAAEGQSAKYWKNRIRPYFDSIWPTSNQSENQHVSKNLARLCIAVDEEFPNAFGVLQPWLGPLEDDYGVSSELEKAELSKQFPEEALDLLAHVVGDETYISDDLATCLREISEACPQLSADHRFARLRDYVVSSGGEVD